jgi:hypothetical protein
MTDSEKIFTPSNYTEKAMPLSSMVFATLMNGTCFDGWSDQRKELYDKNKGLSEKRYAIFETLSPEQCDVMNNYEDFLAGLHYMELTEKFNAGFKLGAMLMKELLG